MPYLLNQNLTLHIMHRCAQNSLKMAGAQKVSCTGLGVDACRVVCIVLGTI